MKIIDPIRIKAFEYMINGASFPINQAIQRFGSKKDLQGIANYILEIKPDDERRYVYIDMTTTERKADIFLEILRILENSKQIHLAPVFMIRSEDIISNLLHSKINACCFFVLFNQDGEFKDLLCFPESGESFKAQIQQDFIDEKGKTKSYISFRKQYADYLLSRLLFEKHCVEIPIEDDKNCVYLTGKIFRVMRNNMLVSSYLDIKELGRNLEGLTILAYEIVLELSSYFIGTNNHDYFDCIVVPNNTSLFVGSVVQKMIGKKLVAIDRLGPIPSKKIQIKNIEEELENKNVVILEEVIATGGEIDRTTLFLNRLNVNIVKFVAVYNLDVGLPMLVEQNKIISLCKPRRELNYEYRSNPY